MMSIYVCVYDEKVLFICPLICVSMFDMFYIHMPNNMQHQMAYHGLGTDQVTDVSGPVTDF